MNFLIKTRSTCEEPQQSVWSRANEISSLGETGHRSGGVKRSRDDARETAFAAAKVMLYRLSVQCPIAVVSRLARASSAKRTGAAIVSVRIVQTMAIVQSVGREVCIAAQTTSSKLIAVGSAFVIAAQAQDQMTTVMVMTVTHQMRHKRSLISRSIFLVGMWVPEKMLYK